jgi:chromosome segregation ATPase
VAANNPTLIELQSQRDRIQFEVETLEQEIRSIRDQLEAAEYSDDPNKQEGSSWWHRANDAKRHKERQRRILVAKSERLQRRIERYKPNKKKAEAKAQLREVLKALFVVAKTAAEFYEHDTEDTETAFTDALDQLDQVVPGWDGPQERKEKPVLRKVSMGK